MKIFLLCLGYFWLTTGYALAAKKTEIVFGFNPAENANSMETNGKMLSEYFQKKTGFRVKTFVATDYTALVEALRSGKIDFAFIPAFSYVKAEELADATVLLKAVRHGKAYLYSAIIVRSDKGYVTIEDLKGKNIAWVDPSSTSGHIIPKVSLKTKKNIDADTFFQRQIFAGAHDALVLAVFNGTVDAGATWVNDQEGKDGSWHLYLKSPEEQKKIKMIFVSDGIPSDTFATTKKLIKEEPELVKKTVSTLQEMHKNPEGKHILDVLYKIDSMVPASAKEYEVVRKAAKALNLK